MSAFLKTFFHTSSPDLKRIQCIISQTTTVKYIPWVHMTIYSTLIKSTTSLNQLVTYHKRSWKVMIYHEIHPDFVTKNHEISWNVSKCRHISWNVTMVIFNTAEDLLTRIINTGWRHCTVYYRFYIDFICNIPLVLKFLFLDLEQPNFAQIFFR